MEESILKTIKKLLGLDAEYTHFDEDLIVHINTAFSLLYQRGIGPEDGPFFITGDKEKWEDISDEPGYYNSLKTLIYQRVRLLFDPPSSSQHQQALTNSISELEWMLYTFSPTNRNEGESA